MSAGTPIGQAHPDDVQIAPTSSWPTKFGDGQVLQPKPCPSQTGAVAPPVPAAPVSVPPAAASPAPAPPVSGTASASRGALPFSLVEHPSAIAITTSDASRTQLSR